MLKRTHPADTAIVANSSGMTAHWRGLRRAVKAITMQARLSAIDSGLVTGYREYRRFIILGQGRTGTNFLRGLLNSHGGILTFGEIFRLNTEIGWGIPLWRTPRHALPLAGTDANAFLEQHVFRAYPPSVAAVGFKLFYNHAQEAERRHVWEQVLGPQGPAVLHLRRRNLLKSLVSLRRAEADGRWVATRTSPGQLPRRVHLTYEECVDYFEQSLRWQDEYDARVAGQSRLNVVYEDLVSHGPLEHAKILEFLGVAPRPLRPTTRQQSQGRLCDALVNFTELERRFSGSQWQAFFED
jgi:LPS sulfotransferase NodH